MKFFSIKGFVYPLSVEDAEDGYFELDNDTGVIVLEAWARGVVFREDGSYVDDASQVSEIQEAWSRVVANHPYFKQKNEDSQTAQVDAENVLYKRLSMVRFGKLVSRGNNGGVGKDVIEILPTIEG